MEKFQLIKISLAYESDTNLREEDPNDPKFKDLVASVKEKGVLVPVIARLKPKGKKMFEIVAGNRRLRAAILAGKEEIPAVIRDLTDGEAREVQIIENLQRADIHPLDEGEGYRALLEKTGQEISEISKRIGKAETYIRQRLKMTDLIENAREMFRKERIATGHAILIARLQPADQAKVIKQLRWNDMSVADIKEWIEGNIMLDLHSAPFKKEECKSCPKRTGSMPSLFPDIKKTDTCTDPACFEAKMQAHIASLIEDAKKEGIKLAKVSTEYYGYGGEKPKAGVLPKDSFHMITGKDDKCDFGRKAVVVEGGNRGQIIEICDSPDCKIHRRVRGDSYKKTPAEIKAEKKRRDDEKIKREKEEERIVKALEKVKWPLSKKVLDAMIELIVSGQGTTVLRPVAKRFGIKPKKKTSSGYTFYDWEASLREAVKKMSNSEKSRVIIGVLLERTWGDLTNKILKMF